MENSRFIVFITLAIALAVVVLHYDNFFTNVESKSRSGKSVQNVVLPAQATGDAGTGGDTGQAAANTGKGAKFVGRKVCGECHQENFKEHAKHGHASTFFTTEETKLADVFVGQEFEAGDKYGRYSYKKDESGDLVALRGRDGDSNGFPLQYVLGSGHNAQTFLSLRIDARGKTEGIEHRVTCYRDARIGLTVGHEKKSPSSDVEKFGDPIRGVALERCIYCHTTDFELKADQVTNLISNVDCEKCHGPGSEHVALARKSPNPPAFSVGMATWDAESEIQLCGDCHRLPRSITQQELREYTPTLTRFQPVGMLRSKCYLESKETMRCTTCHDPHASVHGSGEKSDHVASCIKCHDQAESSHVICPVSPKTQCIDCHMPKVSQGQGIEFHDHWIRVHDQ